MKNIISVIIQSQKREFTRIQKSEKIRIRGKNNEWVNVEAIIQ